MPRFDFDAAVRSAPLGVRKTLGRRPDAQLPFADERGLAGRGLLLDTCVYIDQAQARAPAIVGRVLEARFVNHSTIAVQELMHAVGVLDPKDARTRAAIESVGRIVRSMPPHRLFTPDADALGRAALLAGVLCRLQGYASDRRLRAVQDCVLFLQAQKLGLTVLTANVADFDIMLQLQPAGRALFYRRG